MTVSQLSTLTTESSAIHSLMCVDGTLEVSGTWSRKSHPHSSRTNQISLQTCKGSLTNNESGGNALSETPRKGHISVYTKATVHKPSMGMSKHHREQI